MQIQIPLPEIFEAPVRNQSTRSPSTNTATSRGSILKKAIAKAKPDIARSTGRFYLQDTHQMQLGPAIVACFVLCRTFRF